MCHCTWRFRILGNLSANWQLQIRINFSGLPENQNTAFPLTSSRRLSAPPGHSRLVARSRSTFLASEDNFRWKCWSHSSRQSRLRHVYLMRFSISNPRWKLPDMTIHPSLLYDCLQGLHDFAVEGGHWTLTPINSRENTRGKWVDFVHSLAQCYFQCQIQTIKKCGQLRSLVRNQGIWRDASSYSFLGLNSGL